MPFRHQDARVSEIIECTERVARNTPEEVKTPGFNGLAVHFMLASFCGEVRKINPRVQFGVSSRCASDATHFKVADRHMYYSRMMEVWAYIPGQPYALMRLGCKQHYTKAEKSRWQYGVHHRAVTNGKFNDRNSEYHTAISADPARAVKTAKTHMRPYSAEELQAIDRDDYLWRVRRHIGTYGEEQVHARDEVIKCNSLMTELMHLVESGYEFRYPELRARVVAYMGAKKTRDANVMHARHAWFVYVYERLGKQMFDVIEMYETQRSTGSTDKPPVTYTEETLPEEIAGRIAVLMMSEVGTYVADVGQRTAECTFFIDRS